MKQRLTFSPGPGHPAREGSIEDAFAAAVDLQRRGELVPASAICAAILDVDPARAQARHLLGVLALQRGRIDDAVSHLRMAAPDAGPGAWLHLGQALAHAGSREEAADAYRRAAAHPPAAAAARNGLGNLSLMDGDLEAAAGHYRRALAGDPEHPQAQANLAACLLQAGDLNQALEHGREAVRLAPGAGSAWKCLGAIQSGLGRTADAVASLQRACELTPKDPDAHYQLGCALDESGQWDAALGAHRQALALRPDFPAATASALFLARRLCRWDHCERLSSRFIDDLEQGRPGVLPFVALSETTTADQQRRCADTWASAIRQRVHPLPPAPPPAPDGPLTVGYLSNGFGLHPTGCLTVEYFERHARDGLRPLGYALNPDDGSDWRARLASAFDGFRCLAGRSHADMARTLREDGVDILVDLRGYGGGAVSEVMAMQPAPIQVNWLAYPGTMGAGFMDYIVLDPFIACEEVLASVAETPVILPHAYQPNDTTRDLSGITLRRAEAGLPEDAVVLCSFNNSYKFSASVFAAWMRVLEQVPDSVLWLLAGKPGTSTDETLRRHAAAHGIDPARLHFLDKRPHLEYLAHLALADLFLDTAPYNAHTTASDALWAGCPILTWAGGSFASRVAGSLVHQAGLDGLVVDSLDAYTRLAIDLARDRDALARWRADLASARDRSPLFRTDAFCQAMAEAFRTMAEQCRVGQRSTIRIDAQAIPSARR